MSSIDNRVVQMTFDNDKFNSRIQSSIQALAGLDQSLALKNGASGLSSVDAAANKLNFSTMQKGLDSVINKFSILGTVGDQIIRNLTSSAMEFASTIANKVMTPIVEGGKTRALNLENAKFQLEGLGVAWSSIEDDINYGVKDTAYGLDEAAKAASVLSASGVQVGDSMKTALRGISGVAAMTNSTYTDISDVYATVASNGKLMTEQLRQLSARGLNASATLAKYLGKSEQEVNTMVEKGQIDFATFAAAMDSAFGEHAKDANKTFTGALSNMHAALARIGADFASPAYEALRKIMVATIPVIDKVRAAIKPLATDAASVMESIAAYLQNFLGNLNLGWIPSVVTAIEQALQAVWTILKTIGNAFLTVFPPKTAEDVNNIAAGLANMATNLNNAAQAVSGDVYDRFVRFFDVLKQIGMVLGTAFSAAIKVAISALQLLGKIISILVTVAKELWLSFLDITGWEPSFAGLADAITHVGDGLSNVLKKMKDFLPSAEAVSSVMEKLRSIFSGVAHAIKSVLVGAIDILGAVLIKLKEVLMTFLKSFTFGDFMASLNLTMLAGVAASITTFVTALKKPFATLGDLAKHALSNVSSTFGELTSALKTMQNQIKIESIMKIAIAVGVMAVSLALLASIEPAKLATGLAGLTAVLVELVLALSVLQSMDLKKMTKLVAVGIGLMLFAAAIQMLAVSMALLSALSWDGIARGAAALGILGGVLLVVTGVMSTFSAKSVLSATAMVMVSVAINLLAVALVTLGLIPMENIGKALLTLGVSLGILAVGLYLMEGSIGGAAALLIAAAAIDLLVPALALLAAIPLNAMIKAIIGLAATFAVLGAAAALLSPLIPAMLGLAGAVALFGIGIGLAGAGILAFATAMTLLAVMSTSAANVIVQTLQTLIIGIAAMAPQIGAALAQALASFIVSLAESGQQIITAVLALLQQLIAACITLIPQVVQLAMTLILTLLQAIVDNLPAVIAMGVQIVVELINGISQGLPQIVQAGFDMMINFINSLADGIRTNYPVFRDAVWNLLHAIIDVGIQMLGDVFGLGFDLADNIKNGLDSIGSGIAEKVGEKIQEAKDAIEGFFGGFWDAGWNLIAGLGNGIVDGARAVVDKAKEVAGDIVGTIRDALGEQSPSRFTRKFGEFLDVGLGNGIDSMAKWVVAKAGKMATSVVDEISTVQDGVNGLDMSPTITPVLDSSQLQNGITDVSDMLSYSVSVPSGIERASLVEEINKAFDPKAIGESIAKEIGEVKRDTTVNQEVRIVRSDEDMYPAATILNRSAKAEFV